MRIPTALIAAGVAAASLLAAPVSGLALNTNFSCVPSPTTHAAWSSLTCSFDTDAAKTWSSAEIALAYDESFAHHGDAGTPPDGTTVGTATWTGYWLTNLCTSRSTQNFNVKWKAPDGGYTPPSGWTVVAELEVDSATSLFTTSYDVYIIEDSSGHYKIEFVSIPNLQCTGASYAPNHYSITLGKVGTTMYDIHRNPTTVGTFTDTLTIRYSDGTTDSGSASYTTT